MKESREGWEDQCKEEGGVGVRNEGEEGVGDEGKEGRAIKIPFPALETTTSVQQTQ